mmetsp:Transcript_3244/g.5785  ORF Transcript_3244/g.5785 Transcript_3244/m.5785 type:complete len:222 (-) Transcript_3244:327-992(-)
MFRHQVFQNLYQLALHCPRTPKLAAATSILPSNPRQLVVVLQKEPQPLIAHIHVQIGSQFLLQLLRIPPPRESVRLDLPFNILRGVRQEDGRVGVAAAHLPLRSLQRREKLGVDQRRLALERVVTRHELMGDVAGEPKVRILVDGAGDEARERGRVGASAAQHVGEGAAEGRCGLHGREGDLADVRSAVEAEDSVDLIDGDGLPDAHNVGVHPPHVIEVRE